MGNVKRRGGDQVVDIQAISRIRALTWPRLNVIYCSYGTDTVRQESAEQRDRGNRHILFLFARRALITT